MLSPRNFLAGFQQPFSMSVHPQWGPSQPSFLSPAVLEPHSPEFSVLFLTLLYVAHPHQDVQHLSCVFLLKHFSESFFFHNGEAVPASRQMIGGSSKPQKQKHKNPSQAELGVRSHEGGGLHTADLYSLYQAFRSIQILVGTQLQLGVIQDSRYSQNFPYTTTAV